MPPNCEEGCSEIETKGRQIADCEVATAILPGAGIAIGVAIGVAMGTALHNIGLGIALGVAFGAAFEGASRQKARDRQETGERNQAG